MDVLRGPPSPDAIHIGFSMMHITPITALRSACLLVSCLFAAFPASAQTKPEPAKAAVPSEPVNTTATYGSWVLRCVQLPAQTAAGADVSKSGRSSVQTCEVVQTVQVQGQQQPIAQIAIGRLPNDKDLILTALVPANVSLPGNIHVSGNGKTAGEEKGGLDLVWQRCFGGNCAASGKPDAATVTTMRTGTDGQLRFIDASGQTVAIPLSWKGLEQALAAFEKAK